MKKSQFEKDNESYITKDGYIILDGVFPKLAYKKEIDKLL
ncbi:hypothetical protein LCGC14_0374000 [marine sediment metagenome]|uniref:Uncharacterized protein n=1 Tax=marine sediment metagenome TaxID=412755 RepID=A0A0F9T430_9ZZZZ